MSMSFSSYSDLFLNVFFKKTTSSLKFMFVVELQTIKGISTPKILEKTQRVEKSQQRKNIN